MSNFLNLSTQKSKGLHEPIFKNAHKLKKDAITISKTNASYSTANSLLILSSEEVIKAILVLLHSEGFNVYRIQDAKKFFSDHKVRHELAKLIELINGFMESVMEFENNEKSNLQFSKNEDFNGFLNFLKDMVNASKPFMQSGDRVRILKDFNDNKNKGLYTDYRTSLLIPSQIITKEQFIQSKEIVDRIFKTYKFLKLMYHPKIRSRIKVEKIDEAKDKLKGFVNAFI